MNIGESRGRLRELLKQTAILQPVPDELLDRVLDSAGLEMFEGGDVIYRVGEPAKDLFVLVEGEVEHALGPDAGAAVLVKNVQRGDVIGWAALLKGQQQRLAKTTARGPVSLLRINGERLLEILSADPELAEDVLSRCASMVVEDFTLPSWLAQVQEIPRSGDGVETARLTGLSLTMYRSARWLKSPKPYLMLVGFVIFFGSWFLLSEVWHFWRFDNLPGPWEVLQEWFSESPIYGLSFYTPEYYEHIWVSLRRILIAFAIATILGVPFGLLLGWSAQFRGYMFPLFETLRPVPILAWVPLAIIMFTGLESPVLFLTALASFYATALNTMLGVESIDESYPRAAACLGASRWQVFRYIIIPGALPYMFTGLQISIGVAWFSLVAAEMVSGEFGLGYVINTSYTTVRYPTIVIGMITLGVVGYITSALVRMVGDQLMQWRVRELALGGQQ
jgi:ABC-type nitrate/sulfonate/bicarbonate transport system permease component